MWGRRKIIELSSRYWSYVTIIQRDEGDKALSIIAEPNVVACDIPNKIRTLCSPDHVLYFDQDVDDVGDDGNIIMELEMLRISQSGSDTIKTTLKTDIPGQYMTMHLAADVCTVSGRFLFLDMDNGTHITETSNLSCAWVEFD